MTLLGTVALILAGCGSLSGSSNKDMREQDLLVVRALESADSPIVADVTYREADYIDEASIIVSLNREPRPDEVRQLVCEIVVPALRVNGARESLGVEIWDDHKPVPRLVGTDLMSCEPG